MSAAPNVVTGPPDWFATAIETPFAEHTLEIEDCPIHYLDWGGEGKPGLLFIHGYAAHAHWWRFIAPRFCDAYHPVAIDLSGFGDSDWRESYSGDLYAAEILGVIEAAGLARPVVVAHSFGGSVALYAAAAAGEAFSGLVMVDSSLEPPGAPARYSGGRPARAMTVYPDFETAVSRFSVLPPQPIRNLYISDFIARHSVRQEGKGWSYKFDTEFFQRLRMIRPRGDAVEGLTCPIGVIYGEESSLFPEKTRDYVRGLMEGRGPMVGIPEAQHHLMIDEPLAFADRLREVMAAMAAA